eukprot:Stramenopile-MAST_4_protein_1492
MADRNHSLPNLVKPTLYARDETRKGAGKRKKSVFVSLPLTLDEDTAKYMPYRKVSFPKLHDEIRKTAQQCTSELNNMWVVGMLDHEMNTEKEAALKELSHFLTLPGGDIVPGAVDELWKIYRNPGRPSSAEQRRRGVMVREGVPLTKGEIKRVMGKSALAARLSDSDLARLKEIERGDQPGGGKKWNKKAFRMSLEGTVYKKENKKLRRVIRERRPKEREARVRSRAMEILFEIERRQSFAAIVIQRAYKRYLRLKFWKEYLKKVRAATNIQKIVRGMVAREFVRRWYRRKVFLVIVTQSICRAVLVRNRWKVKKALEYVASTHINRMARGWLARRRFWRARGQVASTKIQRLWRGVVGRAVADRTWLNREISKIQRVVRGHLGRLLARRLRNQNDSAALKIQCRFRGMIVRRKRTKLLWDRETVSREALVQQLRVEDLYWEEQAVVARNEYTRGDFENRARRARQDLDKARDEVYGVEYDYIGFRNERQAVSPRAVRQGFTDALDANVEEFRDKVTEVKHECIFHVEFNLRKLEDEIKAVTTKYRAANEKVRVCQERREAELAGLWKRDSEKNWQLKAFTDRVRIADQKRKWGIKFFTQTGKPDKTRKPGQPWADSALAGPEHMTFYMGGANLMLGRDGKAPARMGTNDSLNAVFDAVHLQSTMNQMIQYGALLKPLYGNMEEATADLIVNDGFPRHSFVDLPPKETGASGPVPSIDIQEKHAAIVEHGNELRQAVEGESIAATIDLESMSLEDALHEAESKVRQQIEEELNPPTPPRKRKFLPYASKIPWTLLDELEAEKHKLAEEKETRLPFERKGAKHTLANGAVGEGKEPGWQAKLKK